MKRILLIISCMVILSLSQATAQEAEEQPDEDIQQLVEKPFFYSKIRGKSSPTFIKGLEPIWLDKCSGKPCDNNVVMLRSTRHAVPIPGTSRILAFLDCPAWIDIQNDSIMTIFDRKNIQPLCFRRLALMNDAVYYWGSIEALEARESGDKACYVVVTTSGADGGDWWTSFAFLRIDMNCRITVLSKLYSSYTVVDCGKHSTAEEYGPYLDTPCGGDKMEYRFLDNKTVEVTTKNFLFINPNTDEEKEQVTKITRKRYDLEQLYQNPQSRIFRPRESGKREDARKDDRRIPLVWAIEEGLTSIATALVDNRAVDVNGKDRDGWTPLMWASENGNPEFVNVLLKRGANVRAKDKAGWTSLMAASQGGHVDVVKLLLEKGPHINERDKDNYTPLMAASYMGHTSVAKLLIEKGADINAKDNKGRTALTIASENGHTQIVELLKAHGARE